MKTARYSVLLVAMAVVAYMGCAGIGEEEGPDNPTAATDTGRPAAANQLANGPTSQSGSAAAAMRYDTGVVKINGARKKGVKVTVLNIFCHGNECCETQGPNGPHKNYDYTDGGGRYSMSQRTENGCKVVSTCRNVRYGGKDYGFYKYYGQCEPPKSRELNLYVNTKKHRGFCNKKGELEYPPLPPPKPTPCPPGKKQCEAGLCVPHGSPCP